ncbi:rho GTPase-activating protein 45 isoform X2 [Polyodon spathula]|uniref:rho GTPase-activating protein 45 isoform X2 n=1 Tax=Polyodon spathula TaxID=7913 RepID=UPI001B7D9E43|nr:rho GTPase-activating protein 45 isoform X2 [Polyodon spathula]
MLKRGSGGGKTSYSPYTVGQRNKKTNSTTKPKTKVDILPNRPNVWLKQLSVLQEQPRKDASESTSVFLEPPSCPGTPSPLSKLAASTSSAGMLKRPTALSRHASAAGFPMQAAGTWGFSKGQRGAPSYSPTTESSDGTIIEVEDISQLLRHVARFAESVEKLKDMVLGEEKLEGRRPLAHECLGEVLRILRQVINTYPLLNTVETLTAAGTLISKVKGFHYESGIEADKKDFEKAIETIAVAFSSSVSELLMGEVDSSTLLSLPPAEKSRSMENLHGGLLGQGVDVTVMKSELHEFGFLSAEEVDIMLQRSEGGVSSALQYAKTISKYMKELLCYVEKRTSLELEFAKGLQKLYQSCKHTINQEPHMPFLSIYSLALEQDMEQSHGVMQTASTLQNQTFLQPLMLRKQEHEKRRKELKELWHRAQRKLMEAESNLRKAKQAYMARCEEHDKAKQVTIKAEEEQQGTSSSNTTKSLDKKRRLEEEARNKAEEAEATYRTCIADAKTQKQELEDMKVNVLRQLQEVIKQSDQTLRSATISYYQIMHMQTAPLPVHYQTLCESSKLYDPGQQYASYVKQLRMTEEPEAHYDFKHYAATAASLLPGRSRNDSFNTDIHGNTGSEASPTAEEAGSGEGGDSSKEQHGCTERRGRGHQSHKSWPSAVSDTDSVGGGSGLESPSVSSGDIRKLPRTSSTGTMSSNEDLEEKDCKVPSFEQGINGIEPEITVSTGPFRNIGLSKAAQTHRLRKLRTPSKCRECDSYVYFQGAECEECFLACHKKCLETLAIQCGHKKLQGKLQLFGRDFTQTSRDSPEGIPFIIKKCISEIERRALKMKGIYRVNGVKTRVEKLCQAFENGKELVELSQASPHDISNVLKLYLRQLPEPIVPFRLYNDMMGLAKESLQGAGGQDGEAVKGPELVDLGPDTDKEVLASVHKLCKLLKQLPAPNIATLQYITRHLRKISEVEVDNKMSSSNLGIVFGPTLMRPRPTGATVSLSSLVDYPHQARIIETLIVFYETIFEPGTSSSSRTCSQDSAAEESPELGEEGTEEQGPVDSDDRAEETCRNSLGSSGSKERSLDSDSEDETPPPRLMKQESETSTKQLCDPIEDENHESDSEVTEGEGQDQNGSLAKHNTNQSNNTLASPTPLPVACLKGGKLEVHCSEEQEPVFV